MTGLLKSVTPLLVSVAILLLGHGLQLTLVPLYAVELGWAPELIGYMGSCYFLGFVVGCLTIPRLVSRVGHIRAFAVVVALATTALLSVGLLHHFWFWLLARSVTGWAFAGVYMVIESWLNEKTQVENRGSMLAVYTMITLSAICLGQLLIGIDLPFLSLFMLGAGLLALGIVPISLTTNSLPAQLPAVKFRLGRVIAASHVAMAGAFFGGLVTGGFWALGPVVASANGLATEQVGFFMAVTILGGTVFQFPIGRLSDRIDRRYVIAGVALVGMLTCILAAILLSRNPGLIYITMFLFGGMTFPLYSLCLAHANDNSELSIMEIASGVLMMHSVGSVMGPLMVGFLLSYSSLALFMVTAAALALLASWTVYRILIHDVTRANYEPYTAIRNTTHEIVEMMVDESVTKGDHDARPDRVIVAGS